MLKIIAIVGCCVGFDPPDRIPLWERLRDDKRTADVAYIKEEFRLAMIDRTEIEVVKQRCSTATTWRLGSLTHLGNVKLREPHDTGSCMELSTIKK